MAQLTVFGQSFDTDALMSANVPEYEGVKAMMQDVQAVLFDMRLRVGKLGQIYADLDIATPKQDRRSGEMHTAYQVGCLTAHSLNQIAQSFNGNQYISRYHGIKDFLSGHDISFRDASHVLVELMHRHLVQTDNVTMAEQLARNMTFADKGGGHLGIVMRRGPQIINKLHPKT